jgi:peptidoglycan/xylan/chitin deacetylase (PgdA/CDA1 family)
MPPSTIGFAERRRLFRRAPLVLAFLAAAIAAVLVVASNTGSDLRSPAEAQANGPISGSARPHRQRAAAPPHQPRATPSSDSRAINRVLGFAPLITGGGTRRRVIALTFDDGPSPYTPAVVSALVRLHVPATFFIVGRTLQDFSSGLRDELAHGFAIGDHTQAHAWLTHLAADGQYAQIDEVAVELERLGAPPPRLFRPPYGVYDGTTMSVLHRLRMLMVLWSIDPGDWRRPGTNAIVSGVLSAAHPGAIVIMHDGGGDRSQTVAALPAIVRGLRRRGYELVTVPQLLKVDPPPRRQGAPRPTGA